MSVSIFKKLRVLLLGDMAAPTHILAVDAAGNVGKTPMPSDFIVPYTHFVDNVNGDDTTAIVGNVTKPFKTINKVFSLYSSGQMAQIIIQLIRTGTYPITTVIPENFIEIKSLLPVTLDFSTNPGGGTFNSFYSTHNSGHLINKSYLYFNIPNGTILNDRAGGVSAGNFYQFQTKVKLNVQNFTWNSTTQVFETTANLIEVEKIGNYTSLGRFGGDTYLICEYFKASKIVLSGGVNQLLRGIKNIDVETLTINSNQNQFNNGQHWNIGSTVNGTNDFKIWYHTGITSFNFNNTAFSIPIRFEQSFGTINMRGMIKNVQFTNNFTLGTLNLENLIIKDASGNIANSATGTVNITNSTIECSSHLLSKISTGTLTLNIKNSLIKQITPTYIVKRNAANVTVNIDGLITNATSIGSDDTVIVNVTSKPYTNKSEYILFKDIDFNNLYQYTNDADAAVGGIAIGMAYINSVTGAIQARLI